MGYFDIVSNNRDAITIESLVIINDETLKTSYVIRTNLHIDYGLSSNEKYHRHLKKKQWRKMLSLYKKATGRTKLILSATDNSLGYTRLVYSLK